MFGTLKYTKALFEMKATSKKYSKEAREHKTKLDLQAKDFEEYTKLSAQISIYQARFKDLDTKIKQCGAEKQNLLFQRQSLH